MVSLNKNYLLLFLIIIPLIILSEFALRFYVSEKSIFVENYEYNYTAYFNSDHFRDDEFTKDKNTFRIFIIGDSFVFGVGVKQEYTFDKLLERKCNDIKCEVYNLHTYGSPSDYLIIAKKFKDYNPDLVIVSLYVDNDIEKTTKEKNKLKKLIQSSAIITSLQTALSNTQPYSKLDNIKIDSFYKDLMHKGKINIGLSTRALVGDNQEYYNTLLERFNTDPTTKSSVLNIKKLYSNTPFLLLINPSKYQTNTAYFDELKKIGFVFNKDKVVNRRLQDAIISWAEENEIDYIDILPFMVNKEDLFFHNIDDHYNEKGNKLIIEEIYNKLNEINALS